MRRSDFQFRRNVLRQCIVPHVRGVHRRLTIEDARAVGIEHFMLVPPRQAMRRLNPSGWIGANLWRVRTINEWLDSAREYHARKGRAHDFSSLGIHHGDYTYLIPVPAIYLAEAIEDGQRRRERAGLSARRRAAA
jgi:hypothetical protein